MSWVLPNGTSRNSYSFSLSPSPSLTVLSIKSCTCKSFQSLFFSVHCQSVQSLSCVWLFATPRTAARQASLSITNSRSLPELMSIESVMPSDHLILYCPLVLLPSIFPSMRLFANESVLRIRWPKYRSFNFSIIPCNEYSVFISFRIDWFDLLAVQGSLKNLLHLHNLKASILQCSAFLMVQPSHRYITTGKTIVGWMKIRLEKSEE